MTERLGLAAADQAAIVNLLCWAWLSPDCSLDPADGSLAVLSRLGDGWPASGARAALSYFFARLPDGRLQARDLAGEREHRARVSAARRRAGKASGEARQRTKRTYVPEQNEHMFVSGQTEPARGGDVSRNSGTQTQMRAEAGATDRASLAAASPIAGPLNECIGECATGDIAGICAEDPAAAIDPSGERGQSSPPHPPYREDFLSSQAKTLMEGGGGGPGGGGDDPAATVDLFGESRRSRPNRVRPGKAALEVAHRVVDAYMTIVRPDSRRTPQADRNAAWWLANGQEEAQMTRAARNYAAHCTKVQRDGRFRKSPANFFSRTDPLFRSYLEEEQPAPTRRTTRYVPHTDPPTPPAERKRLAEELRKSGAQQEARHG